MHSVNLKSLDLALNSIEEITFSRFKGLTELIELHLSRNQIETLDDKVFSDLTKFRFCKCRFDLLIEILVNITEVKF